MRSFFRLIAPCAFVVCLSVAAQSDDLDTQIMLNTFKIGNPKSSATVFVITRPSPEDEKKTQYILVTAGHVFTKMEGEEATLFLRKPDGKDGDEWSKTTLKLKIRVDGKVQWTKHQSADIAIMPFTPPADAPVNGLPLALLATDEKLKQYEIHPGDAMRHVGYPHPNQFEANSAGFPIVRQGCIASFPLTPSAKTKTFICDFNTFEGNSGGPVYFTENNRFYGGQTQTGRVQLILGLLSLQHFINDKYENTYESGTFRHRLGLGVVVHASLIRETIDMLPKSSSSSDAPKKEK